MSQRHVELFIGRLLTDDDLRAEFTRSPLETLRGYCRRGWDLSSGEIEALMQTDVRFWTTAAAQLPSRLRRCSLQPETGPRSHTS
jgi:hypothetical protein